MAIDTAISDPFRRQLIADFAQRNGGIVNSDDPNSGQPPTDPNADQGVTGELDIGKYAAAIRGVGQSVRDEGYKENAALQKTRNMLMSGETSRLDQQTAENARLQSEGQVADSMLKLLTLRQNERLQRMESLTTLANTESQGEQTRGNIQAQGTVDAANIKAGAEAQRDIIIPAQTAGQLATIGAAGAQSLSQIAEQGSQGRLTLSQQQVGDLANIAAQGAEGRLTISAQNQAEIAQIVKAAEEGRITLDAQVLGNLKAIQAQGVEDRLTQGKAITSQEYIALLGSSTSERIATAGLNSQEKQQLEELRFSREQLNEQSLARVKQNEIDIGNMVGQIRDPRTGLVTLTLAQQAQNSNTAQFEATLAAQVSEGSLSRASAERISKWNILQQSSGFDITTDDGLTKFNEWAKGNQLTAQDQKDIVASQLAASAAGFDVSTPEGRSLYQAFTAGNTLTAEQQVTLEKARTASQAAGYDLSTDAGRTAYQKYVTDQAAKYQLSTTDQQNMLKWQLTTQSSGFDLTQPSGQDQYRQWLDANQTKFNLSAADQKAVAVAQIAQGAAGWDLTDPAQRNGYFNYVVSNADKFNLTADEQASLATNKLTEDARQFDISSRDGWDQFMASLDATSQQFNVSAENQMAAIRAQLQSNESIAQGGFSVKLIESALDLMGSPVAGSAFSQDDFSALVGRYMATDFTVDPITKTSVPKSATVSVAGQTPSQRARAITLGAARDPALSRSIYADFSGAFNSMTGQAKFNDKFDFDKNGRIDNDDFMIIASYLDLG